MPHFQYQLQTPHLQLPAWLRMVKVDGALVRMLVVGANSYEVARDVAAGEVIGHHIAPTPNHYLADRGWVPVTGTRAEHVASYLPQRGLFVCRGPWFRSAAACNFERVTDREELAELRKAPTVTNLRDW